MPDPSRREFLGAAAAVAGLPNIASTSDEGTGSRGGAPSIDYHQELGISQEGHQSLDLEPFTDLDLHVHSTGEYRDGKWRPSIFLGLKNDMMELGVWLEEDRALEVAEAIRNGANRDFTP